MTPTDTTWCPDCGAPLTETRTEDRDPESDEPPLVCWGYRCGCGWEAPGEDERLTVAVAPWSRPALEAVEAARKTAVRTERARVLALLSSLCDAEREAMLVADGADRLGYSRAILSLRVAHRRIWEGLHLVPAALPDDRAEEVRLVLEEVRRAVETEHRKEKQAAQDMRKAESRGDSRMWSHWKHAERTYEYTARILMSLHDYLESGKHRRDPT